MSHHLTISSLGLILVIAGTGCLNSNNKQEKTDLLINKEIQAPDNLPGYEIYKEDIYDKPIKTQVKLEVLLNEEDINEKDVRVLLNYLYEKTANRTGFTYGKHPDLIYIYLYTSKAKIDAGMGQWIGMLSKNKTNQNPKIDISEAQFNSLKESKSNRWGLTYEERKQIWNKTIEAEDQARKEADTQHPISQPETTMDDVKRNSAYMKQRLKILNENIAAEYDITVAIIDSIGTEGFLNGWAFPEWKE